MKNRLTTLGILGNVLTVQLLLIQAALGLQTLPPPPPPPPALPSPRSGIISHTAATQQMSGSLTPLGTDSSNTEYPANNFNPLDYGTNLWLHLTNWNVIGQDGTPYVDVVLHNTTNAIIYEILAKTNLSDPFYFPMTLGRGTAGTNQTVLSASLFYYFWERVENYWRSYPPKSIFFLGLWGQNSPLLGPKRGSHPCLAFFNNIYSFYFGFFNNTVGCDLSSLRLRR